MRVRDLRLPASLDGGLIDHVLSYVMLKIGGTLVYLLSVLLERPRVKLLRLIRRTPLSGSRGVPHSLSY